MNWAVGESLDSYEIDDETFVVRLELLARDGRRECVEHECGWLGGAF